MALARFVFTAASRTHELCFAVPVPVALVALGDRDISAPLESPWFTTECVAIVTEAFHVAQYSTLLAEAEPQADHLECSG